MEADSGFGGDATDFLDRLNGAELVVRVHHADQNRLRPQRAANFLRINNSLRVAGRRHGNDGDVNSLPGEFFATVQNRVMLDGGGDDVFARLARGRDRAEEREIVRLRPAASEYNFAGFRADQRGDRFAGGINGGAGALPCGMDRACVAEVFREERQHGVEDRGVHGRGGVVIKIDAHAQSSRKTRPDCGHVIRLAGCREKSSSEWCGLQTGRTAKA